MSTSLRARYVFPGEGPPIEDGVVTIAGGWIVAVGRSAARPDHDLGNVALLPGLINAHTHLEFGRLKSPLGEPRGGIAAWIRGILAYRRSGLHDAAAGIRAGIDESQRAGTVALGEIAQPGNSPADLTNVSLRMLSFVELIAPTAARIPAAKQAAMALLEAFATSRASGAVAPNPRSTGDTSGGHAPAAHGQAAHTPPAYARVRPGLSPHAPYTVHPDLLDWTVATARDRGVPLAMHLAESEEEVAWLRTGGGPLAELLAGVDGFRPEDYPVGRRPLDYLLRLAEAPRTLVVHGNYLDDEEIGLLAARRDRFSVVYCPRTHAYFGHAPYPLAQLLAAGVNVALGTDSRASSPDLSLLAEMRWAAARHTSIAPEAIVRMATLGGAVALGLADTLGSLAPGKSADMVAVALPEGGQAGPYEMLLAGDGPIVAQWFEGCFGFNGCPAGEGCESTCAPLSSMDTMQDGT